MRQAAEGMRLIGANAEAQAKAQARVLKLAGSSDPAAPPPLMGRATSSQRQRAPTTRTAT